MHLHKFDHLRYKDTSMNDLDFRKIVPRSGDARESFEELCCQLVRRTLPDSASYMRLHGAGGDGGVECYVDPQEGGRVGWQAKYVWKIGALLTQASKSLETALAIHPTLTKYVVCFPFDLTGPTGRSGRNGVDRFETWKNEQEQQAAAAGRNLEIVSWPASELRSLLLQVDKSGGIRAFFFNENILSQDWFEAHLQAVVAKAEPRYTPELSVETNVSRATAAFGRTEAWHRELDEHIRLCRKEHDRIVEAIGRKGVDQAVPAWPSALLAGTRELIGKLDASLMLTMQLKTTDLVDTYRLCIRTIEEALSGLSDIEQGLVSQIESEHGEGRADSASFRQFMAEYMVSLPTANLERAREVQAAFQNLLDWLNAPSGLLAFHRTFILSGGDGVGKTHAVCDTAQRRIKNGLLTCVVFGHQFGGEPDPWRRIVESLGLPYDLGRDGLLDALDSAAEASGSLLFLAVDAINETKPLTYWRTRLAEPTTEVSRRSYLRLWLTCRTPFMPHCLPDGYEAPVVLHQGFAGMEHVACAAFFRHYGLKPPVAPMLQVELANPLYLRLACETLRALGLDRLPLGWLRTIPVVRKFLEEKEKAFAREHSVEPGARFVSGSLRAIARAIAESGGSAIPWSVAQAAVNHARPNAAQLPVVEWLVRSHLLIEDAPLTTDGLDAENTLRPSFERFGDFLVASELLERALTSGLEASFRQGGCIYPLLADPEAIGRNAGVLGALAVLLPEGDGKEELPDLAFGADRQAVLEIFVDSLPRRNPSNASMRSRELIREALAVDSVHDRVMDTVLANAWYPSQVDALWIHELLTSVPLARRDAAWCRYLHDCFEESGSVRRLIDATHELSLVGIEAEVAERWSMLLTWFMAAADRRVKDSAMRALSELLKTRPEIMPALLKRFMVVDDEDVRERLLLCVYGALLNTRNVHVLRRIQSQVADAFGTMPTSFDNALIRDHARCIFEFAQLLEVLPEGMDPLLTMEPIGSEWPTSVPSDDEVKQWDELPKLVLSCMDDDFFCYSMNCLRDWVEAVAKQDMGKMILQTVVKDLRYAGSGAEYYDHRMLHDHGGGRGRPSWADRIGKKYQWIAMYKLASRLHDHVVRKPRECEPEPLRTPLILLEERKFDPTLARRDASVEPSGEWLNPKSDLGKDRSLSDADWVDRRDDISSLEDMLSPVEYDEQHWRPLIMFRDWHDRTDEHAGNAPYRNVWIHLRSYLVPYERRDVAFRRLARRNFFGRWMPEGSSWLYGFAGEYPWAIPFNTEPDEWHGTGSSGEAAAEYTPSTNEIVVEWEYDTSIPEYFRIQVPARILFNSKVLWWNGSDGYQRLEDSKTVFRDPSVTRSGPSGVVADIEDLTSRLEDLRLGLVWTLLGEKIIIDPGHFSASGRRTFSQVAMLSDGGNIEVGDRVFFKDYDKDTRLGAA